MCKSAVLFSNKDYSLGEALRYICRDQKVNLIYSLTFPELLNNVVNLNPEIIFYDLDTNEFPLNIYQQFKETKLFYLPKIAILTSYPEKFSYNDENIFVFNKNNFANDVIKLLSLTKEKAATTIKPEKIEEIKNKTTKILSDLGLTTKYLGYEYIRDLVVNIIEDKRLLQSFNKKLYPKIAIKYNTPVNNIERNIRNAITVASQRSKNKILFDEISGRGALFNAGPTPSNKQFITWLVEKVS